MKNIILYIVTISLLASCKKSEYNDLAGTGTISGVAVLADNLNGTLVLTKAPNLTVYLKNSGSLTGYLYSAVTNAQGYYSFSGIDPAMNYTVYASIDTGAVKLYGELVYTANTFSANESGTLKLEPSQTAQNGIHLTVKDRNNETVPFVKAWVFTNYDQFAADDSQAVAFNMTTNAFGVSNKLNIAPVTYYLKVKTVIGNKFFTGDKTVDVDEAGIKDVDIILTEYFPTNGFEITVVDNAGDPVSGTSVYVYRSVYIRDNDDDEHHSSDTVLLTNTSGVAALYNIEPARYYFDITKKIGDIIIEVAPRPDLVVGATVAPGRFQFP